MNSSVNFQLQFIHEIKDAFNDNIDVEIILDNKRYSATFFTLENIKQLMAKWLLTGECSEFTYFRCSDGIILEELSNKSICSVVTQIIENGEFFRVFTELHDYSE